MKKTLLAACAGLMMVGGEATLANECICKTNAGVDVHLVGLERDRYEIYDQSGRLVYAAHVEGRAAMDKNQINCGEVISTPNVVAVRVGRENDLLHTYGFQKENGEIKSIRQIMYTPRDHRLTVSKPFGGDIIGARFGRRNDVFMSLCWGGSSWSIVNTPAKFRAGRFFQCDTPFANKTYQETSGFWVERALVPYASPSAIPLHKSCFPASGSDAAPLLRFSSAVKVECQKQLGSSPVTGRRIYSGLSETSCSDALQKAEADANETGCGPLGTGWTAVDVSRVPTASCR